MSMARRTFSSIHKIKEREVRRMKSRLDSKIYSQKNYCAVQLIKIIMNYVYLDSIPADSVGV